MNYIKAMLPGIFLLLVIVCWQNLEASGEAPAFGELIKYGQNRLYTASLNTHMPAVTMTSEEEAFTLMDFFQKNPKAASDYQLFLCQSGI